MRIGSIGNESAVSNIGKSAGSQKGADFGEAISNAAKQLSNMEGQADELAKKIASGDVMELHNAMLAMSKASTALELTVQVRNRVLEAYQEIMRIQM